MVAVIKIVYYMKDSAIVHTIMIIVMKITAIRHAHINFVITTMK